MRETVKKGELHWKTQDQLLEQVARSLDEKEKSAMKLQRECIELKEHNDLMWGH